MNGFLTKDERGLDMALRETLCLLKGKRAPTSLNHSLPFPVYYINKFEHAQLHMEETFGEVWDLRRVQKLPSNASYKGLIEDGTRFPLSHHDPSETDRVLSHLYTIKKAYLEGNDMAMITEDNPSPLLM